MIACPYTQTLRLSTNTSGHSDAMVLVEVLSSHSSSWLVRLRNALDNINQDARKGVSNRVFSYCLSQVRDVTDWNMQAM